MQNFAKNGTKKKTNKMYVGYNKQQLNSVTNAKSVQQERKSDHLNLIRIWANFTSFNIQCYKLLKLLNKTIKTMIP